MTPWWFQLVLGQLRHLLTAGASSLAAAGILSNDQVEAGVGAVLVLISLGFSAWDKWKQKRKEETNGR